MGYSTLKWTAEEIREKNRLKTAKHRANHPEVVDLGRTWSRETMRQLREANPELVNRRKREWRAANLQHYRQKDWESDDRERARSVVNPEDITPRPESCDVCARICQTQFDHCHQQKRFRGWVCRQCNLALGYVNDNPDLLVALAKYVNRHSEP